MQTASEIAARATAWLIRLDREGTPELWEELQQWLESIPATGPSSSASAPPGTAATS